MRVNFLQWSMLFALTSMFANLGACQDDQRQPNRYLIPEGYVGWVRINYAVNTASALVIEDGYRLFKFPENGIISTSFEGETGFATDEYYYYSERGRRRIPDTTDDAMIWGRVAFGSKTIPGQEPTKYEEFFVGTKYEYEQFGIKHKDTDLDPIIGPIDKTPMQMKPTPGEGSR